MGILVLSENIGKDGGIYEDQKNTENNRQPGPYFSTYDLTIVFGKQRK
jgi:hypothetical protein